MKSMKKILGALTALALTTTAASTVVACGSADTGSKTDQEKLDQINAQFQIGIDGSGLTTSNTQADGVALLQTWAKKNVDPSANVTLQVTSRDSGDKLVIGNNNLNVLITVGTASGNSTAKITGVQGTDADKAAAIKVELETGIIGASLDTTRTNQSGVILLNNEALKISPSAAVTLTNASLLTNLLVVGTNTLDVNINVGDINIAASAKILDVPEATGEVTVPLIKAQLGVGIINTFLSATNTYSDTIVVFSASAKVFDKNVSITLTNPQDAEKNLVIGLNTINLTITSGSTTDTVNAKITLTNQAGQDQANANLIKAQFEVGILGVPLTSLLNTQADGLLLLNVRAKLINLNAVVTLTNPSDATKKLTIGTTTMSLTIKVNQATATTTKALLTGILL